MYLPSNQRFVIKFYMWYEVDPRPELDALRWTSNNYRVMVHRPLPEIFHVYVEKNYFRRFTLETMPDKLKEHIAMIHSFDWNSLGDNYYFQPLHWNPQAPDHMKEIGWKTSRDEYCVIMDKSLLDELKGGASNDALPESP